MSTQVAPNPQKIMQYAFGFVPSLAVSAAVRLRVFEAVDQGHATPEALATQLGCHPRGLSPLLHTLASLQLLNEENGKYSLPQDSKLFLVPSSPAYLGGMLTHQCDHVALWGNLAQAVQTGRPVGQPVEGDEDNGQFFAAFVDSLFNLNYPAAQMVAEHLGQPASALDVGCGSGVWSLALAKRVPTLRVTAVDRQLVLDQVTAKFAQQFSALDRYTLQAGNFREVDFGTGHDVAFLGHILHSEGPQPSDLLLQRLHDCLKPGGRLVIAEMVAGEPRSADVFPNLFDLNMLMWTEEGTVFSRSELEAMCARAGFTRCEWLQTPSPSPILLAHR